jgi:hypothetical protein
VKHVRSRGTATFRVSGVLIIALMFVIAGSWRTSAQEATPSPEAEDMGVCTEALGFGAEGDACVNVVHASPDAPAVDVWVDGEPALVGLTFGTYSGWVNLPAGEHQIQVAPAGTAADQAVIDAELTLEEGAAYEIAAGGLVADISAEVNQINLSDLGDDEARIRVVHASPDAPAVDVAVTGGDVLVPDLEFPDASGFLTVPAGSYDLEVRPAGTTDVALPLPGVVLDPGLVYSVYAIGQLADGSLTVLVVPTTAEGTLTASPEA